MELDDAVHTAILTLKEGYTTLNFLYLLYFSIYVVVLRDVRSLIYKKEEKIFQWV